MNQNVGDVYVIRDKSWTGKLIQIGAILRGLPAYDHVAVMHHWDAAGVPWGVEGRPGGVGWVDMRPYMNGLGNLSNFGQPRTDGQRYLIATALEQILGCPYDWPAIFHDAMVDLGIHDLFAADWHGKGVPGHVVCSAVAAWAHDQVGLERPAPKTGGRYVQPADWAQLLIERKWSR